jgi:hypothetical protein
VTANYDAPDEPLPIVLPISQFPTILHSPSRFERLDFLRFAWGEGAGEGAGEDVVSAIVLACVCAWITGYLVSKGDVESVCGEGYGKRAVVEVKREERSE